MQYDVNTPNEYLASLDLDWRKDKLVQLRALILKQDRSIEESINYKMLCYKINDKGLFHLNAQRGYVSLYCGNISQIDPQGELLKGLNMGKGCIRFTKSKDISNPGVEAFISQAVAIVKQGKDISC